MIEIKAVSNQPLVVFSIDDVIPAGPDLAAGGWTAPLRAIEELTANHESLRPTLFATPRWASRVGEFGGVDLTLHRHPDFCAALVSQRSCEIGLHGLTHTRHGGAIDEFAATTGLDEKLNDAVADFEASGLRRAQSFMAPAWAISQHGLMALRRAQIPVFGSSRELRPFDGDLDRTCEQSGLALPTFALARLRNELVHIPTNFQFGSSVDAALRVLDANGVLSVKAHFLAKLGSHVAMDAIDGPYLDDLHLLFSKIESEFGNGVHWVTFSEAAVVGFGEE